MTAEQLKRVFDFESGLAEGHSVLVRWTCSGKYFEATGVIEKINKKTFVVALGQDVFKKTTKIYDAGYHIKVPRIENLKGWTANNRVEPVGGYQ